MRRLYIILSISTFLILVSRLYISFQTIYFGQDTARDAYLIRHAFETESYIFGYGPKASVWNFYLPPFYYQLHFFFSLLTGFHPYTMQIVITVIESFTPFILFFVLREYFKNKISFFGMLIYAFSPLVVKSATTPWNPSMIPFFSTFMLLLIIYYLKKNKGLLLSGALLCLSILIHLHYQSIVLIPFIFIVFLYDLYKNRLKIIPKWFIDTFIFIIPFIPYIAFEMINQWKNTSAIIEFFTGEHKAYYDRVSKPAFFLTFLPSFIDRIMIGTSSLLALLGKGVFFIGITILTICSIKKQKVFVLFMYIILILFMFRVYKGDKPDYYMSTLFILPAILLSVIFEKINSFYKLKIFTLALMIIIFSGVLFSLYKSVPKKTTNHYLSLKNTTLYISKIINKDNAHVVFLHPNFHNQFVYAFSYIQPIRLSPNSQNLILIGGFEQSCILNDSCKNNPAVDYTQRILVKYGEKRKETKIIDNEFIIRSYRLENKPKEEESYMIPEDQYGNDRIPLNIKL